jgi:hypothetical protein
MIGFIGTTLQLQPIMAAHSRWLSKTRSIPYWTTNIFSSTVTKAHCSLIELLFECRMKNFFRLNWMKNDDSPTREL